MPDSNFAVPGKRKLLVHDKTHAKLAWSMVNRTHGLTPGERASARGRIKGALKGFGVDTSGFNERNSWGSAFDVTQLSNSDLSVAWSFVEDLSETDAIEFSQLLSEEAASRLRQALSDPAPDSVRLAKEALSKYISVHQRDMLLTETPPEQNLTCCFSDGFDPVLTLSDSEERRLRIPVARMGTYVHPVYGTVDFSQKDFDEMQENFRNNEAGFEPYLRYGHARYPKAVDAEERIGTLEQLEQEGEILWGVYKPLDDTIADKVKQGRYAYSSAEIKRYAMSKTHGAPIGTLLTAHALTNAPFVPGLPQNQVLSDQAAANRLEMVLDTSDERERRPMAEKQTQTQALSDAAELDTLVEGLSDGAVQALRAALAKRAGADPNPEVNTEKPAGIEGLDPAAAKLSNTEQNSDAGHPVNKPAGVEGMDPAANKLSEEEGGTEANSHGAPLAEAGAALKKMAKQEDKESMSMWGEFLSSMANLFKGGRDGVQAPPAPKAPPAKPANTPAPKAQNLSETATPIAEGGDDMDKSAIQAMVTEAVAGVRQEFSDTLAAKDAKIADLEAKLTKAVETTQHYSNSLLDTAWETEKSQLVGEGIAPVTVHAIANLARPLVGTVQKFSDGTESDLGYALLRSLRTLPGNARVEFHQNGEQLFSDGQDLTDGAANPYADVISRVQKSGPASLGPDDKR